MKHLFFDGSPKFKLNEDFYILAGIVGDLDKFDSVIKEIKQITPNFQKRNNKNGHKILQKILDSVGADFQLCISIYDPKFSKVSDKEYKKFVSEDNPEEKGKLGAVSRFWAQSIWLPVEEMKTNFKPIVWIEKEEKAIIDSCKFHFLRQNTNGSLFVQHKDEANKASFTEKQLQEYFHLPHYVANYFMKGFNRGKKKYLPTNYGPFDKNFRLNLMYVEKISNRNYKLRTTRLERRRILNIEKPVPMKNINTYIEKDEETNTFAYIEELKGE